MLRDVLSELDNTYVFFTSDNGFHFGEHRFHHGKQTSYEEDIAVPMIVSGPGVGTEGATRKHVVLNQDLAPTFAEIADAETPPFVDGRSFLPVLGASPPPTSGWRDAFLVNSPATASGWLKQMPNNLAVRTPRYEYIDYSRGKDELYDMTRDPHQAHSIHADPPAGVLAEMKAKLAGLRRCAAQTCTAAEGP